MRGSVPVTACAQFPSAVQTAPTCTWLRCACDQRHLGQRGDLDGEAEGGREGGRGREAAYVCAWCALSLVPHGAVVEEKEGEGRGGKDERERERAGNMSE